MKVEGVVVSVVEPVGVGLEGVAVGGGGGNRMGWRIHLHVEN